MRNTKRRLEPFSFFNTEGITTHLEKMARKGWMIEKINNMGWYYRRMEPRQLRFAVSFYPKASQYDPEPTEGQQTFIDFCAHTGWKLACTSAQLQIFYNEQENPIPIETEPELEVESIRASAAKSIVPSYFLLLGIGCFYGWIFAMSLAGNIIATLADPSKLFLGVTSACLILLCITELVAYFRWQFKAADAAENGIFLAPPNTATLQKVILAIVFLGALYYFVDYMINGDSLRRWILIAMCIYIPTLFLIVNGMRDFLKRVKAAKGINRFVTIFTSFAMSFAMMGAITGITLWAGDTNFFEQDKPTYEHNGMTWVIHSDELPLVIEDLMEVDSSLYSKERSGNQSFFLGDLTLHQRVRYDLALSTDAPDLNYRIVLVKLPSLYETCKKRLINEAENSPVLNQVCHPENPTPWGAKEAYRVYDEDFGYINTYLLCYEDILVEIDFDWEITEAQKAIVGKKLGFAGR